MILDIQKIMLASADKKMNWNELLKHTRISSVTLERIKHGRPVQMKTAGKLAEVLGVSVSELLKV